MPGKPGKPREPPGGQRAASGREEPASAIVSLRSPPLSRGDGALFGTSAYLQNHRRVFTATLPGAFCLPKTTMTGAAGSTQPPGLPSESSSRPKARASGAMSACSQSGFSKLPQWSQWGGVFYKDHFLYNK